MENSRPVVYFLMIDFGEDSCSSSCCSSISCCCDFGKVNTCPLSLTKKNRVLMDFDKIEINLVLHSLWILKDLKTRIKCFRLLFKLLLTAVNIKLNFPFNLLKVISLLSPPLSALIFS